MRLIENHPERSQQMHMLARGVVAGCTLGVLGWAVWPIAERSNPAESVVVPERMQHADLDLLDDREVESYGFTATLWYEPPPARIPERSAPAVASVRFELLAILDVPEGGSDPSGLVYDPKDDQVRSVRLGDELHGYRVSEINANGLTLVNARSVKIRLNLNDEEAG